MPDTIYIVVPDYVRLGLVKFGKVRFCEVLSAKIVAFSTCLTMLVDKSDMIAVTNSNLSGNLREPIFRVIRTLWYKKNISSVKFS